MKRGEIWTVTGGSGYAGKPRPVIVLSRLMVDKIITVAKSRVGKQIGRLDDEDVVRLNRAVVVFLGLAGSS